MLKWSLSKNFIFDNMLEGIWNKVIRTNFTYKNFIWYLYLFMYFTHIYHQGKSCWGCFDAHHFIVKAWFELQSCSAISIFDQQI